MNESIEQKLADLPSTPGVYLMKDAAGQILYVGKAASLRSRVRSYFQSPDGLAPRTQALVSEIADLEAIRPATEPEAFLLEDALIKRHQPRFNVRLRDDKRYPYLRITSEPFPRVLLVRRRQADGGRYFGPFTNVKAMRATLKLAQKLFPIRTCTLDLPLKTPRRPCLNFDIGRCLGPCAGTVSETEYATAVDGAARFLEGRVAGLAKELRAAMEDAATLQEYERAAGLRDRLGALLRTLERQSVVSSDLADRDAIGLALGEGRACAQVFLVREGRLSARETFHLRTPEGAQASDVLESFLTQYYAQATTIPREVLLPEAIEETEAMEVWLTSVRGGAVRLIVPKRGDKRSLVLLASDNARFALKASEKEDVVREAATVALVELAESLSLATYPERIEAFDISNTQGQEATGSMVVFEGGRPRRDAYRRFKVHISGKSDDVAMMSEVLRRRFRRGLAELADPTIARGKFSELPDLLLVDGGRGQLNAALAVLKELNIEGLDVLGLAKRQEEIYAPDRGTPLSLPADSRALLLLRHVRDEAHRFAVSYRRRLRTRRSLGSVLDEVPGVGPKRKSALVKAFGSLERVLAAPPEEISRRAEIPLALAERILSTLSRGTPQEKRTRATASP
ncbi:MAG: excinuclease ABC subunit UvrC [Candidatus Bipolaricaulota bacterium]|nr:excinuclease ABC subunit UvrC [Candidatus Bipolaricaulota bacterium]